MVCGMTNTQPQTNDEWRAKVNRWAIGIVVALVVVIGFVGCVASSINSDRDPNNADEAIAQCEARIEKLLKAPSTAAFASTATSDGSWVVKGTVDSQNGFGAMVQSSYQCTVDIHDDAATTTVDYLDQ